MSYEDFAIAVVRLIEGVGAGIMVVGGLFAFARYARQVVAHASDPYRQLRANIGRVILLGLEVLIVADIIRTIVVDQSLESVGVLALIVGIRIVLSFSLEVEIDGAWPWNGWRLAVGRPGNVIQDPGFGSRRSGSPTGRDEVFLRPFPTYGSAIAGRVSEESAHLHRMIRSQAQVPSVEHSGERSMTRENAVETSGPEEDLRGERHPFGNLCRARCARRAGAVRP